MKTKLILILSALMSLYGCTHSNNAIKDNQLVIKDDHLNPVEGFFDMSDSQVEYRTYIQTILMRGLKKNPEVRYLVTPSFEAEYLFQIEKPKLGNIYGIVVRRAKESIYEAEDKSNIEVETWSNSLSEDDADLIITLFRRAVSEVKNPEVSFEKNKNGRECASLRLDGECYYFSSLEQTPEGIRTGVTWSPYEGSNMKQLVDIANQIIELANGNNGTIVLPKGLKRSIVNLTNELKKSAQ